MSPLRLLALFIASVASSLYAQNLSSVRGSIVDPTGAGDSFCGAYAACRLLGHEPFEAARRAAASAALIVGCSGVESALKLAAPTAQSVP